MDPEVLARRLPVLHRRGSKRLALPVYKIRTQGIIIDEAAEQIVFTLGMCHALKGRLKDSGEAIKQATAYLRRTFTGDLLLNLEG